MIYFVVGVKIKVIGMKVSVPKKLESLELDLPRESYEFSKLNVFCRSRYQNSVATSRAILVRKAVELGYAI